MSKQRSGGLGRGLAALIPTDECPTGPRLGDAADIIMGTGKDSAAATRKGTQESGG